MSLDPPLDPAGQPRAHGAAGGDGPRSGTYCASLASVADNRLRLRAIVVSTCAALRKVPAEADIIRVRSHALLDELTSDILANGAGPAMLDDIQAARHEVSIPVDAPRAIEPDGGTTR